MKNLWVDENHRLETIFELNGEEDEEASDCFEEFNRYGELNWFHYFCDFDETEGRKLYTEIDL